MSDERREPEVFPRDADWTATGGRRTTYETLKMHWPKPDDEALSACGRTVIDNGPNSGAGEPPEDVPQRRRCLASGCRQRWVPRP